MEYKYRQFSYDRLANMPSVITGRKEFLSIGPVPNGEGATQVGHHYEDGIAECVVYAGQLQRQYGDAPEGCEFVIIANHHEAGTYHEVGILFNLDNEQAEEYAYQVEGGIDFWDETSREELRKCEHHLHTAKIVKLNRA